MTGITPIVLPTPITWDDAKIQEAKNHIKKLDTLLAPNTTNYTLYLLALGQASGEVALSWRESVALDWYQRVPQPIKQLQAFFWQWLTYTPYPETTAHPAGPGKYIVQWDYLVNTDAGLILANMDDFKAWFTTFLNLHGDWINSTASTASLPDWLSYQGTTQHPFNINEYEVPEGGFQSFNQFFLRNLHPNERPLGDNVVVAPSDGGVFYLQEEQKGAASSHTLPGKSNDRFDLIHALPAGYGESFVGGPLLDILLWFTDYHHFHAPVSGTVVKKMFFPGSYNYDFDDFDPFGYDPSHPGPDSDQVGWYKNLAKHQRYVWIIENEELGNVAMIAIGFWGVGSIIDAVKEGDTLEQGQYMGHFGYGGSSIVLAFEPGKNLSFAVGNQAVSNADFPLLMKVRENLGKVD